MSHWKPRTLLLRLALPALVLGASGTGAALLTLPATASALPTSSTQCSGYLTPDPQGKALLEPDLTDYSIYCNGPFTAYTITVDRVNFDNNNVDDYNPNPLATVAGTDGTPSPTESVNCGGEVPSNGINCYALDGAVAGPIATGDAVTGAIDLTHAYCSYLPTGAKPGTPAIPRAVVSVIITDSTGAQDGPFELYPTKACAKVPKVVPAKTTTTKPKATKSKTTKAATATKAVAVK